MKRTEAADKETVLIDMAVSVKCEYNNRPANAGLLLSYLLTLLAIPIRGGEQGID